MIYIGVAIVLLVLAIDRYPRKLKGVEYNPLILESAASIRRRNNCVAKGCRPPVGRRGYYQGMPTEHCWYCGKKLYNARLERCEEWITPLGSESNQP